ncbi:MAG: phospholipid carrier-dependent glycosyltransferase [Halobacteriales archaeon]|nr:phospholipid carrier-dependent glycosyltransferase [Halobacteriales archaeon]
MDFRREVDPTSQIAQERVQPGPPGPLFLALAGGVAAGVFAVAFWLGHAPAGPTVAEATEPSLVSLLGLAGGRAFSALCAAATVGAAAAAGRRLLHSDGWGLLAALLVALDPAFLAMARLALPDMVALAGLTVALAAFLSGSSRLHWAGSAALWVAALADPSALLWSLPLALLLLVRGHIYAAPRHLGLAVGQALGIPVTAAALHLLVSAGTLPDSCLALSRASALALSAVPDLGSGVAAAHNPASWFGGIGAILFLGTAGLALLARQFRIARLPGRVQLRIGEALPPLLARGLWLLLLALLAPSPLLWVPLFALALGAGVEALAEDAPGFGVAVAGVVVLFAVLGLVRAWGLVAGGAPLVPGTQAGLVPWGQVVRCIA